MCSELVFFLFFSSEKTQKHCRWKKKNCQPYSFEKKNPKKIIVFFVDFYFVFFLSTTWKRFFFFIFYAVWRQVTWHKTISLLLFIIIYLFICFIFSYYNSIDTWNLIWNFNGGKVGDLRLDVVREFWPLHFPRNTTTLSDRTLSIIFGG